MTRFHVFFTSVVLATLLSGCNKQANDSDKVPPSTVIDLPLKQTSPSPYKLEDLTQEIRATLNTLGMSVANNITVNTVSNNVTLAGTVMSEKQKQMVLNAVREIEGINLITDEIMVVPID
ncbi:BON domain-containing protein [Alteromonas facilis]|uniref:BON domain-containing protein n=1 Tax=Alteromonas facilis TaxID=2048004 RepID=UPI000F5CACD7|nr:BON domain-containing protein [Alteromonas facilis]